MSTTLENLQNAKTLSDLALLLGYKPSSLSYILYQIDDSKKYTTFQIGKKSGGVREIKAPIDKLKRLQRSLAELLVLCDNEITKKMNIKNSLSHGFKKDHSIITNAEKHKNKRHVFNVDLKNFFPSINFGRVRGYFIKNKHFLLEPKIATIIAQIACHDNELPQGSPCSPVISNLIGNLLDIRMVNLAKRSTCTYSRYADDLTFSTNKKEFPKSIATQKKGSDNKWVASKTLKNEVKKVGFKINKKKTSMQFRATRQVATGLIVNKKVNVKREYYKLARSMAHSLFQTNSFYLNLVEPSGGFSQQPGNLNQLEGILSFVYHIRMNHELGKDKQHKNNNNNRNSNKFHNTSTTVRLYKDFLFYKHFFALDKPLIVTEGKTDPIYLKCALKSLCSSYKALVEQSGKEYTYKIDFLNKSDNFLNVFFIGDGSSGLVALMEMYEQQMKLYKGEGRLHPVIFLADNDQGAKKIKDKVQGKLKKVDLFQRYTGNLYVAFVPKIAKKDTEIEDYFYKKVLSTELNGKKFGRKDKINPATEYSKQVFANKVIKPNHSTINFKRFNKVFDLFLNIIDDYKKHLKASKK